MGMLYPANSAIFAPNAMCFSVNGVFFMHKIWSAKIAQLGSGRENLLKFMSWGRFVVISNDRLKKERPPMAALSSPAWCPGKRQGRTNGIQLQPKSII